MTLLLLRCLVTVGTVALCWAFSTKSRRVPVLLRAATYEPPAPSVDQALDESITTAAAAALIAVPDDWQHKVDQLLMIDTPCATRRKAIIALLSRSRAIVGDVASAVRTRDLNKVAPADLAYGKAVLGLAALRRQMLSDIIPGSIKKGVPRLVREAPAIARGAFRLLRSLPRRGRGVVGYVGEVVQDPSMLQYTLDTLKKEVKNTFKVCQTPCCDTPRVWRPRTHTNVLLPPACTAAQAGAARYVCGCPALRAAPARHPPCPALPYPALPCPAPPCPALPCPGIYTPPYDVVREGEQYQVLSSIRSIGYVASPVNSPIT